MKKLFIALCMTIGLIGYVTAQTTSITVSNEGETTAIATITLSEKDKATVAAADKLMAVACTFNTGSLQTQPQAYSVGDNVFAGNLPFPVVYADQPTFGEDGATLTLNLVFPKNTEDSYLWLYTGKKTGSGESATWAYTKLAISAEPFQPKRPEIKISDLTYTSMKLTVTLSEEQTAQFPDKEAVLIVRGPSLSITHNNNEEQYQVGDRTGGSFPTTVIYHDKPELSGNSFTLDINNLDLNYGEENYIMLCFGTQTSGKWTYTNYLIYTKFKTKQLDVTASEVKYNTFKASITLDAKMKTAYAAAGSIVAFTSRNNSGEIIRHDNNAAGTRYKIGDQVANKFPVVFEGKPALTADGKLEFECIDLEPGSTLYLYVCLGTEKNGKWNYATNAFAQSSEAIEMKSITAPTELTVGDLQNGELPLTIEADANYTTMIVKSPSGQSINPKGNLKENDTYKNYATNMGVTELVNTGTVMAFLEPGVKTYNLPMTAGEACYVHAYAVANPETDLAAYAPQMAMTPVYRMAEKLPLSYTFSVNDYITEATDRMPILPPGLSTTAEPTDDELDEFISSAFSVQRLQGEETDQYLLWSSAATDNRWTDWVAPEFTGVTSVQARFKTMLLSTGWQTQPRKVATGDEVRVEYSLNGGEWQLAKSFTATNFPTQEGTFYNLTVDFKCKRTDVVRIRYNYRSSVANTILTVASYEILEDRTCAIPANLQAVPEKITGSTIALTWEDQNVDEAASFMVYYENAAVTEANGFQSARGLEATIDGLLPGTPYNVCVQAVCGRDDSSFFSTPIVISTAKGIPYRESMATEKSSGVILKMPDVSVYAQADLKDKTTWKAVAEYTNVEKADAAATGSWDAYWCSTGEQGVYYSMGIPANTDQALMISPVISIPTATATFTKILTFKANPYKLANTASQTPEHNADLPEDIRLYVLASTDGFTTWDTLGEYDHTALSAGSMTTTDENPGKTFSLPMDKYQGSLQLGFYFRAPESNTATEADRFLEIHSVELDYNQRIQPYELEAEVDEFSVVLKWKGEGDVYRIFYGLASAENYTDTLVCEAKPGTMMQFDTIKNLQDNTAYKAGIVSYSNGFTKASPMTTTTFTTLEHLYKVTAIVTPEDGGTVTGTGEYFSGRTANLTATANSGYRFAAWKAGDKELSTETKLKIKVAGDTTVTAVFEKTYTLTLTALPAEGGKVEGADSYKTDDDVTIKATANANYKFLAWINGTDTLSKEATHTFKMPAQDVTYTALFVNNVANEELLKAGFQVGTQDGQLYVRNLNGIAVKDIDIYGLTGNLINRFAPNSREDLMLPIDAQRAMLFVRLNTEKGVVVYKVYLQ